MAGIGVIVDRSGGQRPDFGCPFVSLIEMKFEPGGIEYVSTQSVPQLMPAGVLVTTPPS